jgi:hypothetical protein
LNGIPPGALYYPPKKGDPILTISMLKLVKDFWFTVSLYYIDGPSLVNVVDVGFLAA